MALRRAIVPALSAFSRSQGPPGTACIKAKVIRETTKRTGISQRIRRMTKPATSTLREHCYLLAESVPLRVWADQAAGPHTHVTSDARRRSVVLQDLDRLEEDVADVLMVRGARGQTGDPRAHQVAGDAIAEEQHRSVVDNDALG